jgi:hypothetical protein
VMPCLPDYQIRTIAVWVSAFQNHRAITVQDDAVQILLCTAREDVIGRFKTSQRGALWSGRVNGC